MNWYRSFHLCLVSLSCERFVDLLQLFVEIIVLLLVSIRLGLDHFQTSFRDFLLFAQEPTKRKRPCTLENQTVTIRQALISLFGNKSHVNTPKSQFDPDRHQNHISTKETFQASVPRLERDVNSVSLDDVEQLLCGLGVVVVLHVARQRRQLARLLLAPRLHARHLFAQLF